MLAAILRPPLFFRIPLRIVGPGVLVLPPVVDLFFRLLGLLFLARVRILGSGVLVLAPVLVLLFRLSY